MTRSLFTFLKLWLLSTRWHHQILNWSCFHIFHVVNVFDPCDPKWPQVNLIFRPISFVAIYPFMLLTKFGKNPIKHVEEEADCEKEERTRHSCVIAMTRTLPLPFFDLWPRNRRSDEEVTMETFACLPKDYMLTPLVWQFDVVWNLTFMMWHIWPFDPLNDLRSWWKKYTCTKSKCIVPNQVKSFYYL